MANPADKIQIELRDENLVYLKDVFPITWADFVKIMDGMTETDAQTLIGLLKAQVADKVKIGATLSTATEMQLFFRKIT